MNAEGQEQGPYEPVADEMILAAIERAIRHGTEEVWIATVGEHLGFKQTAHNTRRLRRDLERLSTPPNSYVERSERLGRKYWTLTARGMGWLVRQRKKGNVDTLPESPQHRQWRRARATAAERINRFRELLSDVTEEAETAETAFTAPPSAVWFELGKRLAAAFWLVGSAIYCRDEWDEPADERFDSDPNPGAPPGLRAVTAWTDNEAVVKGEQP
jgi:hypothetical protein